MSTSMSSYMVSPTPTNESGGSGKSESGGRERCGGKAIECRFRIRTLLLLNFVVQLDALSRSEVKRQIHFLNDVVQSSIYLLMIPWSCG